jgi:Domain of unknown function (DUF4926)
MTTHLPNGDRAILDIRKLEDYCLSPSHPRGRHNTRVFRRLWAFNTTMRPGCEPPCLRPQPLGRQCRLPLMPGERTGSSTLSSGDIGRRGGKNIVDCANRRGSLAARDMLGGVMTTKRRIRNEAPSVLDVVALLADLPAQSLARGQVGTAVEQLDNTTWLVEFSDDDGRAYAVAQCQNADLLVLHYVPEAA